MTLEPVLFNCFPFAFSHLRVACCPCCSLVWFGAMGHPLLLTYYFLTWHFISLISHFPLLGWMLSAVFTPSFTLALSLPLKAVLTDVSCGLRRLLFLDPSEAVQHRPQDWAFLGAISKKAGLMVKKLTFYGHPRQTQEFQAVFSLWYWWWRRFHPVLANWKAGTKQTGNSQPQRNVSQGTGRNARRWLKHLCLYHTVVRWDTIFEEAERRVCVNSLYYFCNFLWVNYI